MKKFVLNSFLFVFFLPIVAYIIPLFLLFTDIYIPAFLGNETYYSISKSKQKKKAKKILIGDSVARQLFPNTTSNDTINSLACNQAIGLVGHFILLNNYLNAGNKVDTVYMLFTPFSYNNNLNQIFTYQYFLKPFYKGEYLPLFTHTVNEQINKIPYFKICQYPLILTSNWAPDFISKDKAEYTFLSPVSVEYLIKIKELGVKNNFKLIFLPPLLSLSEKPNVDKMDRSEVAKTNLDLEFENYFKGIIYLDDTNFVDGAHLKYPQKYSEYYKDKFMK
jgi:hypothetical protein